MVLSKIVNEIKESPTFAIAGKASKMKLDGIDVISLSTGEPDFDTPDHVKNAAMTAMQNGDTKYTAVDGTPALKEAIRAKFKKDNDLEYSVNQISVGTGAKQVIFNALIALIDEGDEVIIPAPYWVSYPEMVMFARGKPVIVPCTFESNFKLTAENLKAAITSKTKILILNSPSNPTGVAYTREELKSMAEVLLLHPNIYIICDDIYEHIIFDGFVFHTLAAVAPAIHERVITVNGVSKAYAMTGWRIGYAGAPMQIVKAMSKIQSQSTSNPCSISQAAAVAALVGDQSFVKESAAVFEKRRDLVLGKLAEMELIRCHKPEGAFYLFPSCDAYFGKKTSEGRVLSNSLDFCDFLLESALVAVVPGSAFGLEGFFRISYATSEMNLEKACFRIKNACADLRDS